MSPRAPQPDDQTTPVKTGTGEAGEKGYVR